MCLLTEMTATLFKLGIFPTIVRVCGNWQPHCSSWDSQLLYVFVGSCSTRRAGVGSCVAVVGAGVSASQAVTSGWPVVVTCRAPVGLTRPAGILDDTRRRRHFAVSVYTSMVGTGHNDNQLSPSVPPNGSWECIYRERKKVRCVAK